MTVECIHHEDYVCYHKQNERTGPLVEFIGRNPACILSTGARSCPLQERPTTPESTSLPVPPSWDKFVKGAKT